MGAIVNTKSLSEQVYAYLRSEMAYGKILPGSNINIAAIADKLGISKTPLRDALIQLQFEGFVSILPRKGVVVNTMTIEDVRKAYEAAGAVECDIVRANGHKIKKAHIDELKELNAKLRSDILHEDFSDYFETNLAFHEVYLRLSDNELLKEFIRPIKQRLYDFPRRKYYIKGWELRNCEEHEVFINYLEKGQWVLAGDYLRDVHWSFEVQESFILEFHT